MAEHAKNDDHTSGRSSGRRVMFVVAICALCVIAIALVAQTVSFNARSTRADNIVTFGAVTIQTVETAKDAHGQEVAVPEVEQMSESAPASRIVRVKNVGEEPAFVRVKLSVRAEGAQGGAVPADDLATYVFDDARWVEQDGWYYFDAPLAPGDTTGALITGISFDVRAVQERTDMGKVHLDIVSQGVQVRNNAASAFDAEGWPEEAGR